MNLNKDEKILGITFFTSIIAILVIYSLGLNYYSADRLDALFNAIAVGVILLPFFLLIITSGLFILCDYTLAVLCQITGKNCKRLTMNSKLLIGILLTSFAVGILISTKLISGLISINLNKTASTTETDVADNTAIVNSADLKTFTSDKYGFSFKYPATWSFYDNTNKSASDTLELLFAPVPTGTPWGDSFQGSVRVYEHVTDFQNWFTTSRKFSDSKIAEYIKLVNDTYGTSYISKSDITTVITIYKIANKQAISELTTIKCKNQKYCMLLGNPVGYDKHVYIYNANKVIDFHVATYAESDSTKQLDSIINGITIN